MGPAKSDALIGKAGVMECGEKNWALNYSGIMPWVLVQEQNDSPVGVTSSSFEATMPMMPKSDFELSLVCHEKSIGSGGGDCTGKMDEPGNIIGQQMVMLPLSSGRAFSYASPDRNKITTFGAGTPNVTRTMVVCENDTNHLNLSLNNANAQFGLATISGNESGIGNGLFLSDHMTAVDMLDFSSSPRMSHCQDVLGDAAETTLSSSGERGISDVLEHQGSGAVAYVTARRSRKRQGVAMTAITNNVDILDPFGEISRCHGNGEGTVGEMAGVEMGLVIDNGLGLGPALGLDFSAGAAANNEIGGRGKRDNEDEYGDDDDNDEGDSGGAAGLDDVNLTKEERARRRRDFHKVHTRRSRAKLNDKMDELRRVLPAPPAGRSLKSKAQILDWAISFASAQMAAREFLPSAMGVAAAASAVGKGGRRRAGVAKLRKR
jgi:hypothetical protein